MPDETLVVRTAITLRRMQENDEQESVNSRARVLVGYTFMTKTTTKAYFDNEIHIIKQQEKEYSENGEH